MSSFLLGTWRQPHAGASRRARCTPPRFGGTPALTTPSKIRHRARSTSAVDGAVVNTHKRKPEGRDTGNKQQRRDTTGAAVTALVIEYAALGTHLASLKRACQSKCCGSLDCSSWQRYGSWLHSDPPREHQQLVKAYPSSLKVGRTWRRFAVALEIQPRTTAARHRGSASLCGVRALTPWSPDLERAHAEALAVLESPDYPHDVKLTAATAIVDAVTHRVLHATAAGGDLTADYDALQKICVVGVRSRLCGVIRRCRMVGWGHATGSAGSAFPHTWPLPT